MENIQGEISNLMHSARLQDYLLQTYRSMHLTTQSILFAIGVGLTVANAKGFENEIDSILILTLTIFFAIFGVILSNSFMKITKSREEDVTYFHEEIKKVELKLKNPEERHFTNFKAYQEERNIDFSVRKRLRIKMFDWMPKLWFIISATSIYFSIPEIKNLLDI